MWSLLKLVLASYSAWTIAPTMTQSRRFLFFNMLPNIGLCMPRSEMWNYTSRTQWIFSLTWTSHIFLHGPEYIARTIFWGLTINMNIKHLWWLRYPSPRRVDSLVLLNA